MTGNTRRHVLLGLLQGAVFGTIFATFMTVVQEYSVTRAVATGLLGGIIFGVVMTWWMFRARSRLVRSLPELRG